MALLSKRYVDRSIQTSHICSTRYCTLFSTVGDTHWTSVSTSDCDERLEGPDVAERKSGDEKKQLEAPELPNIDDDAYINNIGSTCSVHKCTGIGSGRPSEWLQQKRVISLPDVTSSGHKLGWAHNQARIVSMPERDKLGNLELPASREALHGESSNSTEVSYYSADSNQGLAVESSETERLYPADLPQTPSPPSSPDSVMIIGNEGQVAGSFLRRSCTDDDGWTSWACSPPRPIPALHGPLSLPYARCPSGAEGTVVEGDDLSNKIWGLSMHDNMSSPSSWLAKPAVSQAHGHPGSSRNSDTKPLPRRNDKSGLHDSVQYGVDAIIDLSKPSTFRHTADASVSNRSSYAVSLGSALRSTTPRDTAGATAASRSCDMRYGHPPDLDSNPQRTRLSENVLYGNESFVPALGLGLNWNGPSGSFEFVNPNVNNDPRNRLNTAAPVFVPAHDNRSQKLSSAAYIHTVQDPSESLASRQYETQSRVHASSQYRMKQDYILSTPNTVPSTPPRWSSVLPQTHGIAKQKNFLSRYTQQHPNQSGPRIYSPQLDADNQVNRLRLMMEQLRGNHSYYNTSNLVPAEFPEQKNIQGIHPQHGTVFEHSGMHAGQNEVAFSHNNNAIVNHEFIPDHEIDAREPGHAVDDTNIAYSSERRRNLSHQHPRSIPLARLIQRRLSAVAEEDGRDGLLPMLLQQASHLPIQHFSRDGNASVSVYDTGYAIDMNLEDAQERIESAVSVEEPLNCPDSSGAVVNLPRNRTNAHSRENYKLTKNDVGSQKENIGRKSTSAAEYLIQSKRQRERAKLPSYQR